MFNNRVTKSLGLAVVGVALGSCGAKDAFQSATNALSSPTASSSGTQNYRTHNININFVPTADTSADDVKTAEEIVEDLEERLEATTTSACVTRLDLTFKNRPSGDSGLGSGTGMATEATTGEAATAASTSAYATYATQAHVISSNLLAAGMCLANQAAVALPTATSGAVDLLATVTAGFGSTATFTKFELSHGGTDASGNTVYNMSVTGTVGGKAFLIESENAASATGSAGHIHGYYDTSANSTPSYFGFSLDYSGTDTARTNEYRAARNRGTASNDFFDTTTGKLDFKKGTAIGEDLFFIKFKGSMSDETRDGAMLFAWQAGNGDSHAWVFQADIRGTTGNGFFSYGHKLNDTATTEAQLGKIHGMICDWALTNGADHATQATNFANKAMKQVMTLTDGKFVSTEAYLDYAPHTSCNGHATYTVSLVTGNGNNLTAITSTNSTRSVTASFTNNLQTITDGFGLATSRIP